ncbi:MAG: hypothetical protein ABSE08_12095 [Syntrophobacteraceae bacterium]
MYMLCPGVPPRGGRVMKCLKAHKAQLFPECRAGIGGTGKTSDKTLI